MEDLKEIAKRISALQAQVAVLQAEIDMVKIMGKILENNGG